MTGRHDDAAATVAVNGIARSRPVSLGTGRAAAAAGEARICPGVGTRRDGAATQYVTYLRGRRRGRDGRRTSVVILEYFRVRALCCYYIILLFRGVRRRRRRRRTAVIALITMRKKKINRRRRTLLCAPLGS